MASGKRASMREGPLAALCRRTEDDSVDATTEAAADAAAAEQAAAPQASAPEAPASAPHPSLLASTAPVEEAEIAPPSPQERLRAAFSSDIPENMLEPPRRM